MEEEIMEKAGILAKADFAVNKDYANAPYKVRHKGELYKAYVRYSHRESHPPMLEVIKPEQRIGAISVEMP